MDSEVKFFVTDLENVVPHSEFFVPDLENVVPHSEFFVSRRFQLAPDK